MRTECGQCTTWDVPLSFGTEEETPHQLDERREPPPDRGIGQQRPTCAHCFPCAIVPSVRADAREAEIPVSRRRHGSKRRCIPATGRGFRSPQTIRIVLETGLAWIDKDLHTGLVQPQDRQNLLFELVDGTIDDGAPSDGGFFRHPQYGYIQHHRIAMCVRL